MNSDSGHVEWGSVKLNSADAVGIDAEVEPCLSEVGEACDPGHVRKASNWEAVLEVEGVGVQVHLVGTAHVSAESCEEVAAYIRRIRPQVVAVELCPARKGMLQTMEPESMTLSHVMGLIQRGQEPFAVLYGFFLSSVCTRMNLQPGMEFRVAHEEARRLSPPAKVVLVDRPVHVTIARMWAALSTTDKIRLLWSLLRDALRPPTKQDLASFISDLKNVESMSEAIAALSELYPGLVEPLIDERDQYLACRLWREALALGLRSADLLGEKPKIVAVVGAGHVKGIKDWWGVPVDIVRLLRLPTREEAAGGWQDQAIAVCLSQLAVWGGALALSWAACSFVQTTGSLGRSGIRLGLSLRGFLI